MWDPGEGEGPGWWRCTSWISGAITTENQFRNCDRQPRLAAVVHNARVYYEMLLHFIDDWNEAVGRVEWGIILSREFLPHSTRPTASFQSSEIHVFSLYWRLEITFSDLRTKWVNHWTWSEWGINSLTTWSITCCTILSARKKVRPCTHVRSRKKRNTLRA